MNYTIFCSRNRKFTWDIILPDKLIILIVHIWRIHLKYLSMESCAYKIDILLIVSRMNKKKWNFEWIHCTCWLTKRFDVSMTSLFFRPTGSFLYTSINNQMANFCISEWGVCKHNMRCSFKLECLQTDQTRKSIKITFHKSYIAYAFWCQLFPQCKNCKDYFYFFFKYISYAKVCSEMRRHFTIYYQTMISVWNYIL